jgi:uncharacterized Zn finger protein
VSDTEADANKADTPFWKDPEYQGGGPIRVDNGLRAKSRRGSIGSTWWSRRFIDVLESLDVGGRLARGRSYARSGQVLGLEVGAGSISATVQGSRSKPYEVSIHTAQIWPTHWERIERKLSEQVIYSAKLLAGEMPEDLEDVFAGLGLSLFPDAVDELDMDCSCPDFSVPCKHLAAALYLLAEAFDRDPFLILSWRGRDKTELLNNLRRLRNPNQSTVDLPARPSGWDELRTIPQTPLNDCVDTYYSCQGRLTRRDHSEIIVPDAILREREPLLIEVGGRPVTDLLRPAYFAMENGLPDREL